MIKDLTLDEIQLTEATIKIMTFCQEQNMSEILAYAAMIHVTKAMEEKLGFGVRKREDA